MPVLADQPGFSPVFSSILQNVTDEIMVFIKRRKIVMPSAMNADQRYFIRVDLLQSFTMPDWYEPIFGAMNDIGMAVDITDPFICTQMKS